MSRGKHGVSSRESRALRERNTPPPISLSASRDSLFQAAA